MYLFKRYYFFFLIFFIFFFSTILQFKNCFSNILPYDMVYVPGDAYTLLFKENEDVTTHEVNYFFVDKYPVTNKNYLDFLYFNRKWAPIEIISFFSNKDYLLILLLNENFFLISNDPVVCVSWYSSIAFCKYFLKRLPLIDEWEYMSAATDNLPEGINNPTYIQKILSWYTNSIGKGEYSIKTMFSNYWNIFGLHSTIWEWVYDFNSIFAVGSSVEGNDSQQLLYCGAASENSVNPIDYIGFMRFAFRNSLDSTFAIINLGFRCVRITSVF